ncbi:MAG: hypothetical protein CM1200mP36_07070 [Gammaproteobacteria bacterium]|nr:MAG: hypothetical protein CM1200mP36_07070 [Gammaproteobacteria bacterium]
MAPTTTPIVFQLVIGAPWFLDSQEDFLVKLRLASGFLRRYCLVELERRSGHDTYARFGPLSCR